MKLPYLLVRLYLSAVSTHRSRFKWCIHYIKDILSVQSKNPLILFTFCSSSAIMRSIICCFDSIIKTTLGKISTRSGAQRPPEGHGKPWNSHQTLVSCCRAFRGICSIVTSIWESWGQQCCAPVSSIKKIKQIRKMKQYSSEQHNT